MGRLMSFLFFVLFSGCGLAAVFVSIAAPELRIYYHNRKAVERAEERLEQLKKIEQDYNILLERLKSDPNFIKRAIPPVLASLPNEPNTAYPKAQNEQLKAAARALAENSENKIEREYPDWLERCSNPKIRWTIFFCGAALVIISLVFFLKSDSDRQVSQNEEV